MCIIINLYMESSERQAMAVFVVFLDKIVHRMILIVDTDVIFCSV